MADERTRYSDAELEEFKQLILKKLENARADYELLRATIICRVGDSGAQQLIVRARILKLFQDELLELLEFGVAVSGSFVCHSRLLLVGFM